MRRRYARAHTLTLIKHTSKQKMRRRNRTNVQERKCDWIVNVVFVPCAQVMRLLDCKLVRPCRSFRVAFILRYNRRKKKKTHRAKSLFILWWKLVRNGKNRSHTSLSLSFVLIHSLSRSSVPLLLHQLGASCSAHNFLLHFTRLHHNFYHYFVFFSLATIVRRHCFSNTCECVWRPSPPS